ncbi:MAG: formylglycine-generating enzyme family protein [Hydrococcus sp. C42_A2020_068]|nr:formylglycine-generating enzyme family protein [Hydrococcus sp. C42_A2020_068]
MNTRVFEFDVATVKSQAQELKLSRVQGRYFSEELGNGVVLEMVAIPAGIYAMGSPDDEIERYDNERPQHWVAIEPFFMSKYPITQAQWQAVATLDPVELPLIPNPSKFKGADRPVEKVSWYEAVEFCRRLSKLYSKNYRLPTEAEWEYACRAGTITPFHFGKRLPQHLANTHGSQLRSKKVEGTTPVGAFGVANAFGLYDMHGNVYEWCLDLWHDDYEGAPADGSAWLIAEDREGLRVIRGGFWLSHPKHCCSAYRDCCEPDSRSSVVGLRVVCEAQSLSISSLRSTECLPDDSCGS